MMKSSILALLSIVLNASLAHAWDVNTCNGHISGMRTTRSFTADLCNMPTNSMRWADVNYAFNEWNKIAGVADRFRLVNGDSDCQIDTDDAVAFADIADIDGFAGLTVYDRKRCGLLDNSSSDGRYIDIKIYVATQVATGPSSPRSMGQNSRNVLFHEMGHALGGEHDATKPNMLWNPSNGPRTGDTSTSGVDSNRADGFLPNDVSMGARWHGTSGGAVDIAVTGQRFLTSTGFPQNLNSPFEHSTLVQCPGSTALVIVGHMIKGKNSISSSAPFQARIVGSSDTTIGVSDLSLVSFQVWGDQGSMFENIIGFTVPSRPPGTLLRLGFIVDPTNVVAEQDETNNSIYLGIDLQIASGC